MCKASLRKFRPTNGLSAEVAMAVMSAVEESRIRNLAKFVPTVTYISDVA